MNHDLSVVEILSVKILLVSVCVYGYVGHTYLYNNYFATHKEKV